MKKKLKTKKAVLKRFKITGTGKILRRAVNQDHFNAKDTPKTRRAKRKYRPVAKAEAKLIRKYLPYL